MSQQDERAAFEAWARTNWNGYRPEWLFEHNVFGEYASLGVAAAWAAWQARATTPTPPAPKDDGAASVSGNGGPSSLSVRAEVAEPTAEELAALLRAVKHAVDPHILPSDKTGTFITVTIRQLPWREVLSVLGRIAARQVVSTEVGH